MTKYSLLFVLLLNINAISQEENCSVISYKQTYNLSNTVSSIWKLYATNRSSLYLETNIKKTKGKVYTNASNTGSSRTYKTGRKNTIPSFYMNNKNAFYFREYFHNETILVKEANSDLNHNWAIGSEVKMHGTIQCTKATTVFRGRNYTAWYANQIPLPYGPWKFFGLPGLILEIYDDEMAVHFVADKIQINKLNNCEESINDIEINNPINIVQYQERKDRILDDIFKQISSRQPVGSQHIKRDKNCTDCGDKLEYFN